MSEETIVPMTRRVLADAIDGYDDQITALQNAKRELYNTSRAQLAKAGYKPAAAKAEVEACKAAIRKRRAAAKNQQAVEERDALLDKIFEEISSPRAREDEAGSLSAGYASSNESLEDRANPDAVRQGSLSGTEGDALVEETYDEVSSVRPGRATRAYEDEAASLPGDPRSSEILEGNPSPDAVPQGRLSETEGEGRCYIVCRNEAEAEKDAADRRAIVDALDQQLKRGDKALIGNSAYRRYLRTTSKKAFEIDPGKLAEEARYDGLFVLRTNARIPPLQAVLRYRDLMQVEQLFRTAKALMRTRPIYHSSDAAIRGHVFCSFLALILRKELDEHCRTAGFRPEWGDVLRDLDRLQEVAISKDGRQITLRTPATGLIGPLFKAARIALPPNVRDANAA